LKKQSDSWQLLGLKGEGGESQAEGVRFRLTNEISDGLPESSDQGIWTDSVWDERKRARGEGRISYVRLAGAKGIKGKNGTWICRTSFRNLGLGE